MRKHLSFALIVLIASFLFVSCASALDLSSVSDDELMKLPAQITAEQIARGLVKSAEIRAGKYRIGTDIPAGAYVIKNNGKYSMNIFVQNTYGEYTYNLALWSTGEETGRIELNEGDVLDINGDIILSIFTGITWN